MTLRITERLYDGNMLTRYWSSLKPSTLCLAVTSMALALNVGDEIGSSMPPDSELLTERLRLGMTCEVATMLLLGGRQLVQFGVKALNGGRIGLQFPNPLVSDVDEIAFGICLHYLAIEIHSPLKAPAALGWIVFPGNA